ncbi:outer envelope pore protein 16, chloroplastic-like [Chenopodium quinoa]|uniref:outer envelope pore protein 16, chloroplastic-like n=1 Tax=Chenopodium quinoa TaxID=63459 RepID=UPI000B77DF54|nr:outer envelope pore protein 16, chloroplastic-like [Chenopodium quinoa]
MPRSSFAKVDVVIDTGNPLLDRTVDGLLLLEARAVAEDAYHIAKKGSLSSKDLEHSLKKMCKEGAYWGTVAGVYTGVEYGLRRARGTNDWKNAMLAGALTGALASAVTNGNKDKIVTDALTGGAVATAAELINYLT